MERRGEERRVRRLYIHTVSLRTAVRDFHLLLAVTFGGDEVGRGLVS